MVNPEIRMISVQIGMDEIPDAPQCLLCGNQTQKTFLNYQFPERDPQVRNTLPVPGYRCIDGCEAEYLDPVTTTLPLFQATLPILVDMQEYELVSGISWRIANITSYSQR